MNSQLRDHFDRLLEEIIDQLPAHIVDLFEESPLLVEDQPPGHVLDAMGIDRPEHLQGLYRGVPQTMKSTQTPYELPEYVFLYRLGICHLAGFRRVGDDSRELQRQIRITLLHEIGHHFGLNEDQLSELGYG